MRLTVSINHVDGESHCQVTTPSLREARDFIDQYDHEGSGLFLQINLDGDECFDVLKLLTAGEPE